MHTKHNPTMASAASPSAADPKMADLCNHTAHASSSDGFAEDGYFKRPIQPNIYGDIWSVSGWFFVGFWVGRPRTRD
jgi:hypothetical protein